jgi:hypothetical protein
MEIKIKVILDSLQVKAYCDVYDYRDYTKRAKEKQSKPV